MTASLSLTTLDSRPDGGRQLGMMVGASLVAHLTLFLIISFMQWAPKVRPLASQEVTLVSLQEAHPRVAAPAAPKITPPVVTPQKNEPPPPAPVRATPVTEPAPTPPVPTIQPTPVRSRTLKELIGQDLPAPPPPTPVMTPKPDSMVRDLMRGMELPPEAPKLGEEMPASTTPSKSSKGFESSVKNLSVPNAPKLGTPSPSPVPAVKPTPPPVAPSLKSLMTQELQKATASAKPSAPPVVAAKPPTGDLQKPALEIRSQSSSPGQSRYLALVKHQISQFWTPPDVQASSQSLQVRIKFRLAPTGSVSNVTVEHSSGVYSYDQAGQRAVLSAVPLPPFPPDLKEAWLDVHISFTVGKGAG